MRIPMEVHVVLVAVFRHEGAASVVNQAKLIRIKYKLHYVARMDIAVNSAFLVHLLHLGQQIDHQASTDLEA